MGDRNIEGVRARDFMEWLEELDNGSVNTMMSEKLLELATAVETTGKKGTLVLKITVKREGDVAIAGADIKLTKPEHAPHATLFYFNDGALVRENPKQLKLKEVEAKEQKKPRAVGADVRPLRPTPAPAVAEAVDDDDDDGEE